MKHTVSQQWLSDRLGEAGLAVVDARFVMGQPDAGRQAYEQSHIPGAVYFDLERDLSAPVGVHGGRHPLPDPDELAAKLAKAGIGNDTRVVAYDDQGGAMASRFWWLLRYLGHEQVYVLDQGFAAWNNDGLPTESSLPQPTPASFAVRLQEELLAGVADVQAKLGQSDTVLLDSREAPRYRGETEPLDKAAGHIPGAVNKFWKGILNDNGRVKDEAALREAFADLPRDRDIIVYCGSGVTATPNVLALSEAGFERVKLYAGSWSDWISYEGNPIATGEEEKA
ncbi:sulfurtransferase [Paenibacillus hodogayensis]|uniref:Sulfurtransferase n=1 Tax=Paenibacillus hodogayensis TaxID=279208 RepID=A0ABV5VY70_9BACL